MGGRMFYYIGHVTVDTPPFPSSRPDPVISGVPVITVRLPCSYVRANQNTGNRVLVTPGPRDILVWYSLQYRYCNTVH